MVALGDDPHPAGCASVKGVSGVWRIRVGDYRICYAVEHDVLTVLVLLVHSRGDVYPQLIRLLGR